MFAEVISKAVVEVAQLEVDVFLLHSRYENPTERKKSALINNYYGNQTPTSFTFRPLIKR